MTSSQKTLLDWARISCSVVPNVWQRAPVIRLLSSDAPPLPVRGAGVYAVLWMWTTLWYYLFELTFAAKWALQHSIWRWACRRMWNVQDLEDSTDNLFQGAIPALTWSKWITISLSLTKLSDAVMLLTCIQMSRLKPSQDTALSDRYLVFFPSHCWKKWCTFPFVQILCYALILPFPTIWSEIRALPIQHK